MLRGLPARHRRGPACSGRGTSRRRSPPSAPRLFEPARRATRVQSRNFHPLLIRSSRSEHWRLGPPPQLLRAAPCRNSKTQRRSPAHCANVTPWEYTLEPSSRAGSRAELSSGDSVLTAPGAAAEAAVRQTPTAASEARRQCVRVCKNCDSQSNSETAVLGCAHEAELARSLALARFPGMRRRECSGPSRLVNGGPWEQ